MSNKLFREKSIERVSSPEALNDYVRVTSPALWMVLTAIIVLLAGACAWGIWGHIETKTGVFAIHSGEQTVCYIPEDKISGISAGMTIKVNEIQGTVSSVSSVPVELRDIDSSMAHRMGLDENRWAYIGICDLDISDGIYEAEIITESISLMSFVLN